MTYEVQTYTLCNGWVNCWSIEENNISIPQTFKTHKAAQAELNEFFSDIEYEIASGERGLDEGYDRNDFKIVKISDKPPTLR